MRIAVWHNLPTGGGLRAMVDQVNGLVLRGHQVVVYCPDDVVAQEPHFADGVEVRSFPLRLLTGRLSWSALPPAPVVLDRLRAVHRHLDLVAGDIARGRFDIVYAGSCRYLRAAGLAARVPLPSVLYLGEPYRWLYEALPELPWLGHLPTGGSGPASSPGPPDVRPAWAGTPVFGLRREPSWPLCGRTSGFSSTPRSAARACCARTG